MASHLGHEIDLVIPASWNSNLHGSLSYQPDSRTDGHLNHIFPTRTVFKGKGNLFFFHPTDILQILNHQKYDAIFIIQETWTMATTMIELLRPYSLNKSTKLFIGVDQNLKKKIHFLSRYIERFNVRNTQALLCVNKEIVDVLRWKGINTDCYWRPWSYDEDSYPELASPPKSEPIRLGYLGRLTREKGLESLLVAQKILLNQDIKTELVIAGGGPLEEHFKNKEGITFLGMFPHDQAQKFYEKIDFFILPSLTTSTWKEQFGRVIIESVAAGKLVIGSSSGAIPEVLGRLGIDYIFNEGNSTDMARVISLAIQNWKSGKLEQQLESAVKRNKELFCEKAVVERVSGYFSGKPLSDGLI